MASQRYLKMAFRTLRKCFPAPACSAGVGLKAWRRESGRDYAYAEPGTNTAWFHKGALRELSREQVLGLVLHELGHLADPGVWRSGSEARADRLAEKYAGLPVNYDEDMIQTTGPGTARPRRLHR